MGFINDIFGGILSFIFDGVVMVFPVAQLAIAIILFTLVARILLTPLQLASQRTTRGMSKIQPELQKIQNKYKGKKDQASQLQQSQEMQALYKKYKINPFAGCLPLLIQFPLILALFNVLREPARYISKLKLEYVDIANKVVQSGANYQPILEPFKKGIETSTRTSFDLSNVNQLGQFLSHLNTTQWNELLSKIGTSAQADIQTALQVKEKFETFLGFNVVDSPSILFNTQWWVILIPIIAGASTYIFTKISMASTTQVQTSGANGNTQQNSAQSMMKTMNVVMPIMTGAFAYTIPIGLALYWIAGNVIMMGQQWIVNKILEKQDAKMDLLLEKEREEARKNNKIQTKKVMKKVPVKKSEAPNVSTVQNNNDAPKTYTKKVIKKVPIQKKTDDQE